MDNRENNQKRKKTLALLLILLIIILIILLAFYFIYQYKQKQSLLNAPVTVDTAQLPTIEPAGPPPPIQVGGPKALKAGDNVLMSDKVYLRNPPGDDGLVVGIQKQGALGVISSDPQLVGNTWFFYVAFNNKQYGWIDQRYLLTQEEYDEAGLEPLIIPPPLPTPTPPATIPTQPPPTPTPTPQPTPQPNPSTKFKVGDRIQTIDDVNVRATPSTSGALLGAQDTHNLGTVTAGPVVASGYNWWHIDYDAGVDGWSVENRLIPYTGVSVTPPVAPPITPPITPPIPGPYYTIADVNAHYRTTDCWIIIGDRVYDITPYLHLVPTPSDAARLEDFCGSNATELFDDIPAAYIKFAPYFVGNLGPGGATPPGVTPPPTSGKTHLIVVYKSGSGTVSGPGIDCGSDCRHYFTEDRTITLTAVPASGYTFTGWKGACAGTGVCTVSMATWRIVDAEFAQSP